jgi:hypothetical protein
VGGAGPLAIDDFVEVVGVPDVGGLQLQVSFERKVYSWIKRGERLTYQKPARAN